MRYKYRRSRADRERATAVTVLSGVVSIVGLGLLYVIVAAVLVAHNPIGPWRDHPATLAALGPARRRSGDLVGLRRLAVTPVPAAAERRHALRDRFDGSSHGQLLVGRMTAGVGAFARDAIRAGRRCSRAGWRLVTGFAGTNWLTDLLCFAGSARAFGLPVGFATFATIYLGAQIIRQIPLTPGGVGLIETGLLAGSRPRGPDYSGGGNRADLSGAVELADGVPIGGLAWFGLRRPPVTLRAPAALGTGHALGTADTLGMGEMLHAEDVLNPEHMLPEAASR